jgi:hypothetical protein
MNTELQGQDTGLHPELEDLLEEIPDQPDSGGDDEQLASPDQKGESVSDASGSQEGSEGQKAVEQVVRIGDREFKLGELEELIRNADTWRNQLPHFQKLYEEERKRAEMLAAQLVAGQPQEAKQGAEMQQESGEPQQQHDERSAVATPEELVKRYTPAIERLVQDGWISEALAEEHPELVAEYLRFRDQELRPLYTFLQQTVMPAISLVQMWARDKQSKAIEETSQKLASIIEELAKEPDFAPLAEEKTAVDFVQHLVSQGQLDRLTDPDWVKAEWVRKNWQLYREGALERFKSSTQNARRERASASANRQGVGHSRAPQAEANWFDDLLEDLPKT